MTLCTCSPKFAAKAVALLLVRPIGLYYTGSSSKRGSLSAPLTIADRWHTLIGPFKPTDTSCIAAAEQPCQVECVTLRRRFHAQHSAAA